LTIAVILVLGILWVAVLVPPILRARGQQSHTDSVGDFSYKLSSLGRANGHRTRSPRSGNRPIFVPAAGPGAMSSTQKRRRDVLLVLLGLVGFTFLLAVFTRSMPFIALQVVADLALAGYVYLLLQYKQRARQQSARTKVRYLGAYDSMGYSGSQYLTGGRDGGPRLVPLRQTASR
jgi:hypothetical protein